MRSRLPFRLKKLRLERPILRASTSPDPLDADATSSASEIRARCLRSRFRARPDDARPARPSAQSRGDDGAASNSRNGPLSVSLYVLHPEKSVAFHPAKSGTPPIRREQDFFRMKGSDRLRRLASYAFVAALVVGAG